MSAPDPDSISLVAKLMTGAAAIVAPVYGAMKYLDSRLEKKADKAEVDRHRDYFVKVFERMDENQRDTTEKFGELKDMIHEHHIKILDKLAGKEDR